MPHVFRTLHRSLTLTTGLALAALGGARAQATLGSSPYVENFNALGTALPTGFSIYTAATASSLGTAATLVSAPTVWSNTGAGFKNFASATGLAATADAAAQAAATNRALGVRQTGTAGTGGDPGAAFVFQATNTSGKTDLSLTFNLQSLDNSVGRTTLWQVDYATAANPTTFIAAGSGASTSPTFSNTPITVSFGSALDQQAGPITIRVVTLAASTGSNSRPSSAIDDFTLSWNAPTATTPVITLAPTALSFGNQNINTTSAAQTYSLSAVNLTTDVALTTAAPFSISKDGTTFAATQTYTVAELATAKTVSVRFEPTAAGPATGSIAHASAGAVTRGVALSGAGLDPNQTSFNFNNCTGTTAISDGWSQFSVTGPQVWACTTFGRDAADATGAANAPNAVQINGFAGGTNVTNEDWLISPAFNLSATTFPLLSYWSRGAFNGAALRLLVSTNYSGTGSPTAAGVTWTDLIGTFPAQGVDRWTQTSGVDLTAFKAPAVYVAFVYNSTIDQGARWTLDDISLTNSATAPPPAIRLSAQGLDFGFQAVNTGAVQTLSLTASNLTGDVTLASDNAAFQLSRDGGATFAPSITLPQATANGTTQAVRVRFQPPVATTNYTANLTVASPGLTTQTVPLTGNTYDAANTLEVVNWNMAWFGSSGAGLGPPDKNLQATNASTIIRNLNADIYALVEVVDTVRLRAIVAQMPGFAYRIGQFGSFADNNLDPDFIGAQKLVFVYRTSVVTNPRFTAFFRSAQAAGQADFTNWASGRFPFVMTADIVLGGLTKTVTFVVLHAKANTSPVLTSYNRRKAAADQLKAKLDADYANQNVVVLGDFNDDLDVTITAGITPPVTSYSAFTTDAANYPSPTLALSLAGKRSTVGFNDMIDHVVLSRAFNPNYLPGTAAVQVGVTAAIPNYGTTTSDHYPILTRYAFANPTSTRVGRTASLGLYPNPATGSVRFDVPETGTALELNVFTTTGRLVLHGRGPATQLNAQLGQGVGGLAPGLYMVQVVGQQQTYVSRLEKL